MVTEREPEGRTVFLCDICGVGYVDRETAQECEDYCRTHNSCSIEITEKAVYHPEEPTIKESE
jgi:hypothetical protein